MKLLAGVKGTGKTQALLQEVNKGCVLDEIVKDAGVEAPRSDFFKMVHPDTCWQAGLEHGEKLGLGTREYELVKI